MDNSPDFRQISPPAPVETAAWEVVFSGAYFKTHVQRLRRCRRRPGALSVLNFLLLAVMGGLNVLVYTSPRNEPHARLIMPGLLALLIFALWARQRLSVRRWRKSPLLNRRVRFGISPAGIQIVDDLSESRTQWAAFAKARRFPDGWLLFFGANLTNWLPDACLVAGTLEEADRLVRTHIAACRDL